MEEKELVKLLKHGDKNAFDKLYEKYKDTALRMAYLICGNYTDSQDVVQESFIKCYQHIHQLNKEEQFKNWFFHILTRTAWRYCKKQSKEVPEEEMISLMPIEKEGSSVQALEKFSNGYMFKNIDVCENKELDADDNVVGKYKDANMKYTKEDEPNVYIYVEKTRINNDTRKPNATREYGEVTLTYYLTHYKFVPVGYELTEEDEANLEKEDYEISVGSDEVEESDAHSVHWEIGELSYSLMISDTDMTSDELFDMAQEVIDTKIDSDL